MPPKVAKFKIEKKQQKKKNNFIITGENDKEQQIKIKQEFAA